MIDNNPISSSTDAARREIENLNRNYAMLIQVPNMREDLARELFSEGCFPDIDTARQTLEMAMRVISGKGLDARLPESVMEVIRLGRQAAKMDKAMRLAKYQMQQRVFGLDALRSEIIKLERDVVGMKVKADAIRSEIARVEPLRAAAVLDTHSGIDALLEYFHKIPALERLLEAVLAEILVIEKTIAEKNRQQAALKERPLE